MKVKAFWHNSSNFGDKLTPYVLRKIGIEVEYVEKGCQEEHYIMAGSIITAANEHSIIWGAGVAQPYPMKKPKQILAVRGPKTRDFLLLNDILAPEEYADPAQLLPMIYKPSRTNLRRVIGHIPHITDKATYKEAANHDWQDIEAPVEEVVTYILESERIVTSSLHVAITAKAYGKTCTYVPGKQVIGANFKFADFMASNPNNKTAINTFPFKTQLYDYFRSLQR